MILDQTNALRAEKGIPALVLNTDLSAMSQRWSEQQASDDMIGHNPNYVSETPGAWRSVAENVAAGYTAETVVAGWQSSPGHYANIMNPNYTDIGIGVAYTSAGVYHTYFTQNFAQYAATPTVPAAPQNVAVSEVSWDSAKVSWTRPEGAGANSLSGYAITLKKQSDGRERQFSVGADRSDYSFSGLEYATSYQVTVKAVNSVGNSADGTVQFSTSFTDIPSNSAFKTEIRWMADSQISHGWVFVDGSREFRPFAVTSRDAFVRFLYRLAGEPEVVLPASSPFNDVDEGNEHYAAIVWAYNQGIVKGWSDGGFHPSASVQRDAVASFLQRYASMQGVDTSAGSSSFADVEASNEHASSIAWLASTGITTGWPDGTYRPYQLITRDAIAAFLYRYDIKF
ncbi:CAP domain-containing protein [Pseudoclavibacter soli]|uniref:CAP domain-containing protein n=1 Tax=Pseudoclavibacter soli TaxID=452623 RepID=UPI00146F8AE5|nr:CAP domain-containing protein [Pseudoclavibacter soli]